MQTAIFLSNEQDYCVLREASKAGESVTIGPDRLLPINELTLYVIFGPKAVGGTVLIEGAHDQKYTGEWAVLQRVDFARAGKVHWWATTGVHLALRIRVLDAVQGDTVSVYGIAN